MYKVRTLADREELREIVKKATRLALSDTPKWKGHKKIAERLQKEIDDMLIFEDYRVLADGTLRRVRNNGNVSR